MKQLLLLPLLACGTLQLNHLLTKTGSPTLISNNKYIGMNISNEIGQGKTNMPAAIFKAQNHCRAELKDFEFDIQYNVVSAVVYFSGTNFKNPERGIITSSSLQPIKPVMKRCVPGSIVTFDEVKVKGPDNIIRTIPGISLILN